MTCQSIATLASVSKAHATEKRKDTFPVSVANPADWQVEAHYHSTYRFASSAEQHCVDAYRFSKRRGSCPCHQFFLVLVHYTGLDCKFLHHSHRMLFIFSSLSSSLLITPIRPRVRVLAAQSAGQIRWTKCECDRSLRSSKTHAGTEQTTLSRLSLADRAWETDDDESLMPGTQITNKTHRDTHTHTHTHTRCMHTRTHIQPLSLTHPSFPIYSVVFFPVPSQILCWQRQMEGLRGEWLSSRGGENSLRLLLCSEMTLIAWVDLCVLLLAFLSVFIFPSLPDLYLILVVRSSYNNTKESEFLTAGESARYILIFRRKICNVVLPILKLNGLYNS